MILIHMRDIHRLDYFALGDMANRYFAQSISCGLPVTARRIYEAIGRFVGKRPRTIRYYAEIAAFYKGYDLSDFNSLPFSFYAYAVRFGDNWRDALEYAAYNPFMSLEELQTSYNASQCVKEADSEQSTTEDTEDDTTPLVPTFDEQTAQEGEPKPRVMSKLASRVLLNQLSDLVDQTQRLIRIVDLPDVLRSRLELDIMDIRDALPEVARILTTKNP
jgi:hypothetical protein